jgi:hypothetical protein
MSADGRIYATRDHNNVRSVLRNTKKRGMLTSGVVLLLDNARPHIAPRTRALPEDKLGVV